MTQQPATPPSAQQPPAPVHRVSATLLALVLPLVVTGAGCLLVWSWRDELPATVPTHWGPDGPDGFGSVGSAVLTFALVAVLTSVLMWAIAFWWGRSASVRRMANGTSVGLAVFMTGLMVGTLEPQRGGAAVTDSIDTTIGLALLVATLVGGLVAWLTPRDTAQPAAGPMPTGAARLPLADGERLVWINRTDGGKTVLIGGAGVLVLAPVAIISGSWWILAVLVVVALLLTAMLRWVVRVDENGLTVRSAFGFPRTQIPLDEVVEASVRTVSAVRDFGGYGWRMGVRRGVVGSVGIIVRSGEALEVTSTGGRRIIVTVDDAANAAGALNALADRSRRGDDKGPRNAGTAP